MVIWIAIVWCVAFGGLGHYVATQKRRESSEGILFGLVGGPFGVMLLAMLPTKDSTAAEPHPSPTRGTPPAS